MVKKKETIQWRTILLISIPTLFFDVLIKQLVQRRILYTSGNNFFDITYAQNTGTMWSLFSQASHANIIFIILSFLAIGFLYYFLKTEKKYHIQISMIIAGILGNLQDRILYGYVIDWANFHFWPIFNIADASLMCGVFWLVGILIYEEIKEKIK
jgi:signal peptidase II